MIWDVLIPTIFLLILATGFLAVSLSNNSAHTDNATQAGSDKTPGCDSCLVNELIDCKKENYETH